MTRRTQRPSIWRLAVLVVLIGIALYVNQVVVPATPPLFIPTPTPTRSPESYVNQAQEFFLAGKLSQSSEAYKQAIASDPSNPSNYISLARLQVFLGEYDQAVENAQNALLQNPNNPLAHAVLGWALGFQGKYGEAELEIKKSLASDPNLALTHAYYAEILMNQGDFGLYDRAAEESKKALDLDPTLLEARRARGIVFLNTQNLEQAVEEFQAALAINKNIADLHLYLGVTYRAMEELGLAQESLLASYALNPTDTTALTELSRAFFADGRYAQAAQYAEEAVKVDPSDPRLHGNLGITYYKNNDYANAIPALAFSVKGGVTEDGTVVEGLPLDYGKVMEYFWYYGFALARSNRCAEAVPIFQALLTGVPNDEIAVYNATEGLALCQAALDEPVPTPTVEEEVTQTP
ncbi:MAG TPA: tetratricopeptide repeat protein [Anaerolineales bacterium]|nr:tetratricopeptide repeat protein [Anaerolineales bacterium]